MIDDTVVGQVRNLCLPITSTPTRQYLQVTVVAQVITIQSQTTNNVYLLDDGVRIEARHWLDSSNPEDAEKWGGILYVGFIIDLLARLILFSENTLVRVTGTLKTFGSKRHINATHIRPVVDAHELLFHLAEAMAVVNIIERGMVSYAIGTPLMRLRFIF